MSRFGLLTRIVFRTLDRSFSNTRLWIYDPKSYVELEYEYAQERGKPLFAVVITEEHLEEKVKKSGSAVLEKEHQEHLKKFREKVQKKLIRFFRNPLEIKLAIHETLAEFSRRDELIGWIPGNQAVNSGAVAEEIARLANENATLRERLSKTRGVTATFSGIAFEEMYQMLRDEVIDLRIVDEDFGNEIVSALEACQAMFEDSKPSLLHLLWVCRDALASECGFGAQEKLFDRLRGFGLVEIKRRTMPLTFATGLTPESPAVTYGLTDDGRLFLLRLRLELSRQAGAGEKSLGDAGTS